MHKLNVVYLAMLNNMWDIENQLTVQLPKIAAQAHNADLKTILNEHRDETAEQKARLEKLLENHGHTLTYERDLAFETLLQDAASDLTLIEDQNVKDAFIVASAQTVEHIEMSRYHTLLQWAKELGDELGMDLLRQTYAEEEMASRKLTAIAEGGFFSIGLNEKAVITGEDGAG
jgi:ferritin-like metal-binding protein YciE